MKTPFRPLGKVRDIIQSVGLDISYAYDDIVFSDNAVFIIRFDNDDEKKLYVYFNSDCDNIEAGILTKKLITAGKIVGFEIISAGLFSLEQLGEKEEIQIKFF